MQNICHWYYIAACCSFLQRSRDLSTGLKGDNHGYYSCTDSPEKETALRYEKTVTYSTTSVCLKCHTGTLIDAGLHAGKDTKK